MDEVIWLLLKYCIYCISTPSLHRESTDSLIGDGLTPAGMNYFIVAAIWKSIHKIGVYAAGPKYI